MSRSVKKGPFVQERLLKRIEAMNEKNEKVVIKTCPERRRLRKKWSDTSSVNLLLRELTEVM